MPNDLNLQVMQRISVAFTYAALLLSITSPEISTALVALTIALNFRFYRFMAGRRGWLFALRTIPMHLLYFLYCGIGLVAGVVLFAVQGEQGMSRRVATESSELLERPAAYQARHEG